MKDLREGDKVHTTANDGEILVVAVEERDVYGNTLFYPKNDVSKIMCQIAGKKTLSRTDLMLIDESMNFIVKSNNASSDPYEKENPDWVSAMQDRLSAKVKTD